MYDSSVSPISLHDSNNFVSRTNDIRECLTSDHGIVEQVAASAPTSRLPDHPTTENDIRSLLKLRRTRTKYFGGEIFADPAWDMLLELYAASLGQRRISVGSLCIGAAVPATTALRWITTLKLKGLLERMADPFDGRRFFLSLSISGLDAMTRYFKTVPGATALI